MVCRTAGGRRRRLGQPGGAQLWPGPGVVNSSTPTLNSKTPPAPLLLAASSLREFKRNVRPDYYLLECGTHSLYRDQNWSKTKLKARPALGWGGEKHSVTPGRQGSRGKRRVVTVMSNLMEAIKPGWIISSSGERNGWGMKLTFRRIILANHQANQHQPVPAERAWTKWGNESGQSEVSITAT